MKNSKMLASGFRVMRRHKLRSFFMMVGIVAGVTILTLVTSIGRGMEAKVMNTLKKVFNDSNILISAGGGMMRGSPLPFGPATTLTLADIEALQSALPEIALWDPLQVITEREVRYKNAGAAARIMGQSERSSRVWNRGVTRGEYFDAEAVSGAARVALIGATLAAELFGGDDPIGRQIRIGDVPFQVLGLLEPIGTDPHGLDRDHEIIVPITTAMRRLMNVDYISGAKLVVRDPARVEAVAGRAAALLRERHRIAPGETDDFTLITPVKVKALIAGMNKLFRLFLPLIALIAVLVGSLVVANLMLISVQERTVEIGLRKAVGARARDILEQFLLETMSLTAAGGLAGIVIGVAAARFAAGMMKIPFTVSWTAVAAGVLLSALAGFLAGVLPARRAAALDPVNSLR